MNNKYISIAAYIGALTVALGAFGAHALKEKLSPDTLAIFDTAVRYQFYHVFALLGAGIVFNTRPNKLIGAACNLFIAGIVIFCGSLYALTFIKNSGNESFNWIGAITPIGGLCFIAGWVCLAVGVGKK
jgi:uncharacterized membrane protein YgdD (TMEM256/DUF423 family)